MPLINREGGKKGSESEDLPLSRFHYRLRDKDTMGYVNRVQVS